MELEKYNKHRMRIMANQIAGKTLLDIGYALGPNPFLRDYDVVGYDKLENRNENVLYDDYVIGDIQEITIKLAGQIFDNILCGELIEHLEDPYNFLRDIHTLLVNGGRFILSTSNPVSFPMYFAEMLQLRKYFYNPHHTYTFLPRLVRRMLEKTGFELVKTVGVGLWFPGNLILWALVTLSYQVVYVAIKK